MSVVLKPVQWPDGEIRAYGFMCPGCKSTHVVQVLADPGRPGQDVWDWNGSLERPTFTPSLRVWWDEPLNLDDPEKLHADIARSRATGARVPYRRRDCHSFIAEGFIDFLGDTTAHELRGLHPLPPHPRMAQRES